MNATSFGRILWKEYRSQRAYWIAMAALTVIMELAWLASPWVPGSIRVEVLFEVALVCAAFYALGSAAMLFATERENETYGFLHAMPVTTRAVLLGKTVFALGSAAAMYLVAWMLAFTLVRGMPAPLVHQRMWILCGLGGVELLAWGIFFSLLLKRTLVAAILAGTIGSIGPVCFFATGFSTDTIPVRLAVLAVVVVAIIALAARWFRERLWPSVWPRRTSFANDRSMCSEGAVLITLRVMHSITRSVMSTFRKPAVVATPTFGEKRTMATSDPRPRIAVMLGRLLWQEVRQSTAVKVAMIVWLLPAVFIFWATWIDGEPVRKTDAWPHLLAVPGFWAILSSSLLFLSDQTRCRFRFLAEQGIPPRLVWLSRQIGGLLVVLAGLLLVLPPTLAQIETLGMDKGAIVGLLGFVVLAYSCGQLCSMVFRSGIIAVVCAMILTALVCGWAALMYVLGMSWSWSVAPMPLAFLTATWLHAPDWLVERRTWRARLRLSLVVALPALAILAAVPLVRVYEIPAVELGFDPKELTWPVPPGEEETLAIYARAIGYREEAMRQAETPAEDRARREAESHAVALALEASRRPLPEFYLAPRAAAEPSGEIWLCKLVLASGKALEAEGKLDAALDRYVAAERIALHASRYRPLSNPYGKVDFVGMERSLGIHVCEQLIHWATQSGQKSDRLIKALRTFEEQWNMKASYCDGIRCNYFLNIRLLEGDREALQQHGNSDVNLYASVARWVPWERVRAVRLLNKLTAAKLARCREIEAALAAEDCWPPGMNVEIPSLLSRGLSKDFTYNVVALHLLDIYPNNWSRCETYRRAARLVLAIEAWKLDHGRLPQSLDDLQGKYLSQIPVAVFSEEEFRYEPKGVSYCVEMDPCSTSETTETIAPNQPFLGWGPRRIGGKWPGFDTGDSPLPPESVHLGSEWTLFPIP